LAGDHSLAADATEPQRCTAVLCGGDCAAHLDRELVTSQRVNEVAATKRVQIGAFRRDAVG
jgi:allophanate hydrolase subunit 2